MRADALYLSIRQDIRVDRSVIVDETRTVDLAADGRVVGIEIVGASAGIRVLDLVERFELRAYLPHRRRAEAGKYVAAESA